MSNNTWKGFISTLSTKQVAVLCWWMRAIGSRLSNKKDRKRVLVMASICQADLNKRADELKDKLFWF